MLCDECHATIPPFAIEIKLDPRSAYGNPVRDPGMRRARHHHQLTVSPNRDRTSARSVWLGSIWTQQNFKRAAP